MVSTQIVVDDDLMEYEVAAQIPFKVVSQNVNESKGYSGFQFIHDDPRPSSGYFCLSALPPSAMAAPVTTEFLCLQIISM